MRFLERVVGRPAVSNEMGQFDRSPSTVVSLLKESVALRLPYVVWFAGDGDPAVGLVDADGTLRANGRAFRDYVAARSR